MTTEKGNELSTHGSRLRAQARHIPRELIAAIGALYLTESLEAGLTSGSLRYREIKEDEESLAQQAIQTFEPIDKVP